MYVQTHTYRDWHEHEFAVGVVDADCKPLS